MRRVQYALRINVVCVTNRKTSRVWEPRMDFKLALLSLTSGDPLKELVLPVPMTLGYGCLEGPVLKDRLFLLEDTATFPLNYKLLLPPGHSDSLCSKKMSHLPGRGHGPWSSGGGGLLSHHRREKVHMASRWFLGSTLMVNGQVRQP